MASSDGGTVRPSALAVLRLMTISNLVGAEPKHDAHRDETVRSRRERKRDEKALDEALKNTFPASDLVSVEQPVLTAAHE